MDQKKKITVWILDDDHDFATYLQGMLNSQAQYEVKGISNSLEEVYKDIMAANPDLVTIDLSLPDGSGVELVKWLEQHMPDVKRIIISFWGQEEMVYDGIIHGANGYLQKDHLLTMGMQNAIDIIESGGTPISPKLAKYFLKHFKDTKETHNYLTPDVVKQIRSKNLSLEDVDLSKRERGVLELLTQGLNYNEIASHLNISYHTVSSHIKNIYKKLNVSSKVEAIIVAKQL